MTASEPVVDTTGAAAPPRRNGELVFDAPWESRAFGIALALHDAQAVDFEDFRARLIEEIQCWQAAHPGSVDGWAYYERWERALEHVLTERGLVSSQEIDARAAAIAHERAHDHDRR